MSVKLVGATTPSKELCTQGIDNLQEFIAYCARVSNPSNQLNTETSEKLIAYLLRNKHWSPMEMASITLEITTTRDIGRQILRHRSFSFQEFSQRYADPTKDMNFVVREARLQDAKNRQNSIDVTDEGLQAWWEKEQKVVASAVVAVYKEAIDRGIAKEQARAILPEGMTETKMYMAGTVRSWIHFITIRSEAGTQKEHRQVALDAAVAIEPIFPMIKTFVSDL